MSSGDYTDEDDDQLTQEDMLIDRGVDDLLDEGYVPPDKWREPRDDETLDELLAEEEPDPAMQLDQVDDPDEQWGEDEVGDRRSGRLVAGEQDGELLAGDVGIDGSAASAEEAAVHIVDE
ncbi:MULTISPECIES: DUF5709 domain-containing protein [Mycolicibacterium]|uniref:Uncharacterized protein n=2 Tax=Mycolicibacterium TaxID=1866885 RepID=A0A7I7ZR89_9MYCO|nr:MULTISPECIES: DUF5709 domain-containing protein [Mycolicibacterium]OBA77904.1 hypothetical protein A5642_00370 [Mycolicibacterium mucogenicum]RUP29503.1 MAG: hypothetical protein EKK51_20290 [Mycolicibacterium sp.]TLH73744.1 hypothetical protein C1S79_03940 [Mycolicibacterium phocaicum]BBZ55837.1 hypothetical protein MPHO_28290 [Mycolicibacterium phocaicum]